MNISNYKLSSKISDDLQKNLPTIEDIQNRINLQFEKIKIIFIKICILNHKKPKERKIVRKYA